MGSDAEVFIFDESAFRGRVVPAVQQFVRTGDRVGWLDHLLRRLGAGVWEFDISGIQALGFSFHEVCNYLGPDFAFAESEGDQWSHSWEPRACASQTCAASKLCPLHRSRSPNAAEDFNFLLQACVVDQCLGPGQFLGRSMSPLRYTQTLRLLGDGASHQLTELLLKLEYRGFVVGYMFANSDGIHGWLTPSETERLHAELHALDLPRFEPSFAAMEGFRRGMRYEAPPPHSFEQLSLAFLRTVAELAMRDARGLLWGNDLLTSWCRAEPA